MMLADLGLIGNCQLSALVRRDGAIVWCCMPRFDSPPRLPADDRRMHSTVEAIRSDLAHHGWLKRYRTNDGFRVPAVTFTLCTLWLVEALARLGRVGEARALMNQVRDVKSPLGLLSEDIDPGTGAMWDNFPQAYSHVGLIQAAFAASPRWSEYGS